MGKLNSGTNVEINSFPSLSLSLSLSLSFSLSLSVNTRVLCYEIDPVVVGT